MPRVSVIIPVYNSAATLVESLASVFAQSYSDFEIVCADDGSSDSSLSILRGCADRIRIVEGKNRGPSAARNAAIAASSGDLLAYLDADDLWAPNYLEWMVAALESRRSASMAWCDLGLIDSQGVAIAPSIAGAGGEPTVSEMLERLWPIMPSAVVMRRASLQAAGGWPERLRAFEDVFLWLLMREQGDFCYVAEVLGSWRFALFPAELKPAGGQEGAGRIFDLMVQERYGVSGMRHVIARRRAPRSILGRIGLTAIRAGDRARARAALARALAIDPWRFKNYLRYARTFLPTPVARALSGSGSARN